MDINLPLLTGVINESLKRGIFLDELKLAEVIPLFKKGDPFDKTNYRPVSFLSHISKVFERIIYNQINEYIEPFLSKVLTGFCKNHNTQHFLLKMLENFKEVLDKGNLIKTIFVDLSKAFDILNHDLLIDKLEADSFYARSLSYKHSYLNKRLQKTNVNCDLLYGKKFSQEFLKGLFLVHFYSIYIY